jgi:hypothetical protein
MDVTGAIQKVASMRGGSGSMWRRGDDVFSRSSREEDDEEALRWAALEKLPTYDRVRRAATWSPPAAYSPPSGCPPPRPSRYPSNSSPCCRRRRRRRRLLLPLPICTPHHNAELPPG